MVTVTATDAAGNTTAKTFRVTVVDTTAPTGSITIDGGAATTTTGEVTVGLAFTDAVGPVQMRFSTDGGATWTAWEPYAADARAHARRRRRVKTVIAQVSDAAGNVGTASASITLATGPADDRRRGDHAGAGVRSLFDAAHHGDRDVGADGGRGHRHAPRSTGTRSRFRGRSIRSSSPPAPTRCGSSPGTPPVASRCRSSRSRCMRRSRA